MIAALKIIFLLGFLILIHETGHYAVARLCKIKVNEFAIGFGPKIWSKAKNGTTYEIRLIPLGGFVSLEGEQEHSDEGSFNTENKKNEKELKNSMPFYKASIPKRIAVIAAGALVNIIFGLLLYFILIAMRYVTIINNSIMEAVKYSFTASTELIGSMFQGMAGIFIGKFTLNDMTGPVGISSMVSQTNGIIEFLYLLSIISVSLGITNLLPIIPLDGGKIILLIIEAMRKRPLKQEVEAKINSIGFIILIFFSLIVTCNDLTKLIK